MLVSAQWKTSCWGIDSAMTLDIGSQGVVIAMEIVPHKTGSSYLLGQKSQRQVVNVLVSKWLVKFDTHTCTCIGSGYFRELKGLECMLP